MFAALELFFSMNDKHIDFKKMRKMFSASIKNSGNEAWSTDDIQRMVKYAKSSRTRALIYLLASTGCRIGAVPELKLKHLVDMADGCKAILFYEGTKEEYWGFLTLEANSTLDEYLAQRKKDGEILDMNTYVFRKAYRFVQNCNVYC